MIERVTEALPFMVKYTQNSLSLNCAYGVWGGIVVTMSNPHTKKVQFPLTSLETLNMNMVNIFIKGKYMTWIQSSSV